MASNIVLYLVISVGTFGVTVFLICAFPETFAHFVPRPTVALYQGVGKDLVNMAGGISVSDLVSLRFETQRVDLTCTQYEDMVGTLQKAKVAAVSAKLISLTLWEYWWFSVTLTVNLSDGFGQALGLRFSRMIAHLVVTTIVGAVFGVVLNVVFWLFRRAQTVLRWAMNIW